MALRSRSLIKLIPNKTKSRRLSYFGMALLVLISVLGYSIFIKPPSKVSAATIASTNGSGYDTVITSDGTTVVVYNAGTQAPTGIAYVKSTDNGASWSSPVQVDTVQTSDFDIAIDGSNNIYIAYASNGIYMRELTYSGGSWSIGSPTNYKTNTTCVSGVSSGDQYYGPSVTVNSSGTAVIDYIHEYQYGGGNCVIDYNLDNTGGGGSGVALTYNNTPFIIDAGKARWAIIEGYLYYDPQENGSWAKVPGLPGLSSSSETLSYGLDQLHMMYTSGGQMVHRVYTPASNTLSSADVISSSSSDISGSIVSDSNKVWAVYGRWVGTNNYDVVYKNYNGSSWDGSPTTIVSNGANNIGIKTYERADDSKYLPVIWSAGSGSPHNIVSQSFSGIGSATDTGNRTGAYTGSLTGSSGDVLVKCGTWYYDTVNIVSGMTVKVCPSNGQEGGKLTIYANSVTVAGTIDGAGRGLPGGIGTISVGGGVDGAGSSMNGSNGLGAYAGSGGSAGANGTGGAAVGITGSWNVAGYYDGGTGGSGGAAATSSGSSGSAGGYLSAGGNGDVSADESLADASGGGSGGSGGAGAGGGSGGRGAAGVGHNGGSLGGGGVGAAGGSGGKGGNAGATIRIYSIGTITVSGSILTTGQAGSAGGAGSSGTDGVMGGSGT